MNNRNERPPNDQQPASNMSDGSSGINPAEYPLAVFICIVAVAFGVLLAWAAFRFLTPADDNNNFHEVSSDQAVYMREVRMRNRDQIAAMTGRSYLLSGPSDY